MAAQVTRECLDVVAQATHMGELDLGGRKVACAVLKDGRRVLSDRGVRLALGYQKTGVNSGRNGSPEMPVFMAANNLKPFIFKGFAGSPISYQPAGGGPAIQGYDCGILPQICRVYLDARRAGKLHKSQEGIAAACEVILLALAETGIAALIDEATGYEKERAPDALQAMFALLLRKEAAKWQETFRREFYERLYTLWGWQFNPDNPAQGPRYAGKLTRDIYERFSQALLEEMDRLNPVKESEGGKKHREAKHHQYLSDGAGRNALANHLDRVLVLLRASQSKEHFLHMLDRAIPKRRGIQLDFGDVFGLDLFGLAEAR